MVNRYCIMYKYNSINHTNEKTEAFYCLKNNYDKDRNGIKFDKNVKMSDVINKLPFNLTKAQLRVLEEIDADMESEKPMNRLLQGDVGSGKTVVSIISAYKAVKSGYQAAIMAPTAILATQHMEEFSKILAPLGIKCELLLGATTAKNKKDILEIDTAKDQEKYGLSFKGITNRYITLENKNLDIFWAKLGIANLNLDKIEPTEYSTQLSSKQDNVKKLLSNSFRIIKEQASKEKYSNLGKMETELDGENVQVSAYELKLSSDEMKQVFSSLKSSNIDVNKIIDTSSFLGDSIENLGFDFTETIYVHGGNLARIQITMKDSYSQTIQIVKTFEKNDITLSIQIENSKGTQIMADITKNSTENNEKYVMNLELTSTEELRIVADINVDIAFNTNATITALTDENSYIINEKSGDDIKDLFQKIFEMIKEREGIENTAIGILYNAIEMGGQIFESSGEAVEKATQQAKSMEEQMSQMNERLEETLRATNN